MPFPLSNLELYISVTIDPRLQRFLKTGLHSWRLLSVLRFQLGMTHHLALNLDRFVEDAINLGQVRVKDAIHTYNFYTSMYFTKFMKSVMHINFRFFFVFSLSIFRALLYVPMYPHLLFFFSSTNVNETPSSHFQTSTT